MKLTNLLAEFRETLKGMPYLEKELTADMSSSASKLKDCSPKPGGPGKDKTT